MVFIQLVNEINEEQVEVRDASDFEDIHEASDEEEVTGDDYLAQIEQKRLQNAALLKATVEAVAPVYVPLRTASATPKAANKKRRKDQAPIEPTRRSARVQAKATNLQVLSYSEPDSDSDVPLQKRSKRSHRTPKASKSAVSTSLNTNSDWAQRKASLGPSGNGRVFGELPGIPVGAWWSKRDECGHTGVHPPTVAGIYWHATDGCYSVAVSAGYPEDLDEGDRFTYTGSGGRELKKKNLRTAPQTKDQELTRGNLALWVSAQNGNPVRVIRGYKAALGPVTGYRYDGLYRVIRAYEAPNSEGTYKVWKYDFVRLPGQVPVDYGAKERAKAEEEAKEKEKEKAEAEADAEKRTEEEANAQLEAEAFASTSADADAVKGMGEIVAAAAVTVES